MHEEHRHQRALDDGDQHGQRDPQQRRRAVSTALIRIDAATGDLRGALLEELRARWERAELD